MEFYQKVEYAKPTSLM